MANLREILAKNMKENRQKLGITQAELAERADISTNFVAMIELKHKFPAPEILEKISAALHIDSSALFTAAISPETAIERLHNAALTEIKQAIGDAVKEAFAQNCKNKA